MPTSDARIRALTDKFVAELSVAIQRAALDAVREALGEVHSSPGPGFVRVSVRELKARPREQRIRAKLVETKQEERKIGVRISKPGPERYRVGVRLLHLRDAELPRGGRQRRSSQDVNATASSILAHVRSNPGSSVGDVGEALGLSTKDLALPIRKLIADRKLRAEGERRGTRYFPK